jgi:hypothetical protein
LSKFNEHTNHFETLLKYGLINLKGEPGSPFSNNLPDDAHPADSWTSVKKGEEKFGINLPQKAPGTDFSKKEVSFGKKVPQKVVLMTG